MLLYTGQAKTIIVITAESIRQQVKIHFVLKADARSRKKNKWNDLSNSEKGWMHHVFFNVCQES